jgi:hypothetical protein
MKSVAFRELSTEILKVFVDNSGDEAAAKKS